MFLRENVLCNISILHSGGHLFHPCHQNDFLWHGPVQQQQQQQHISVSVHTNLYKPYSYFLITPPDKILRARPFHSTWRSVEIV